MATPLPDILGEYVETSKRFQTGGVQYVGYFEPGKIAPEQVADLYLFLQNTLDAPVKITIKVEVPKTKGLFSGGKSILYIEKSFIQLDLAEAEVGLLTLPVITTEHVKEGEYLLILEPKVTTVTKGERIRPAKSQSKLGKGPIDSLVGLNLVRILGATFAEEAVKKGTFSIKIGGEPKPSERAPKLKHSYQSLWTQKHMKLFEQANHEINLRDERLRKELTVEALYVALYSESVFRFADAGLPLRIGEAITLAKILTYSCQFFLSNANRRRGLLVPIWERALDANVDTGNALQVLRSAGYNHILKLAIALSFGIVAQAVGRQPWSLEERQAVTQHIADNIERGQTTEEDFLYLPLLMAGTLISSRVKLDGEEVNHSLALMKKAREVRTDLFFDDELVQADKIYNQILKRALQSSKK